MAQPAGWYHADGDPEGTHRYWDGNQWTTDAQPIAPATPPPPPTGGPVNPASTAPPRTASNPIGWWWLGWIRMFDFTGRSRRRELGWFLVINTIIMNLVLRGTLDLTAGQRGEAVGYVMSFVVISIIVRRLHDMGQSGWWALLLIVPGANVALLLAALVINGKPEANQWGLSPKYG